MEIKDKNVVTRCGNSLYFPIKATLRDILNIKKGENLIYSISTEKNTITIKFIDRE